MSHRIGALLMAAFLLVLPVKAQDGQTDKRGQSTTRQPRVSAAELLGDRPAMTSFTTLREILDVGREVVVTDNSGRARRGRVASLSDGELVLARALSSGPGEVIPPLLWPVPPLFLWVDVAASAIRQSLAKDRAFMADGVTRIDVVDSTWNGTLLGGVVGAGVAALTIHQGGDSLGAAFIVLLGFPASFRVGHVLDRMHNRAIYQRPASERRVGLAPFITPRVSGALISVRLSR